MEWVETTADTIEQAKERALDQLGVHPDDAEFELLNDARTGLFGRIKDPARVRARVRPRAPRAKNDRRHKKAKRGTGAKQSGRKGRGRSAESARNDKNGNADKAKAGAGKPKAAQGKAAGKGDTAQSGKAGRDQSRKRSDSRAANARDHSRTNNERSRAVSNTEASDQPAMSLEDQADVAQSFVEGLAERFGASVECSRTYVEENEIRITVLGDDLGRMVGRGGTTARAIDDLTRTVLQRRAGSSRGGWVRVDVGGVRARRVEFLAKFCREQAQAVRDTGVARVLEPMGAADRKVVHDTVATEDGVSSASEGEDPSRRVVILPARDDA